MLEHSVFVLFVLILFYLFLLQNSFGKRIEKETKKKRKGKTPGN